MTRRNNSRNNNNNHEDDHEDDNIDESISVSSSDEGLSLLIGMKVSDFQEMMAKQQQQHYGDEIILIVSN